MERSGKSTRIFWMEAGSCEARHAKQKSTPQLGVRKAALMEWMREWSAARHRTFEKLPVLCL